MSNQEEDLKAALERLKKAKKKIDKKHQKSVAPEPKTLVSGQLDELEIRRRQKSGEDDE